MDGAQKKQTRAFNAGQNNARRIKNTDPRLSISESENANDQNWKSFQRKVLVKKFIFFSMALSFFAIISYGGFIFWKLYSVSKKISPPETSQSFAGEVGSAAISLLTSQRKILSGEESGRINILLLGAAGEKKPGSNLTDTIMLASIDTASKKISLLSLPRDLYVKIPSSKSYSKINSLYQIGLRSDQGVDLIRGAVEDVTGQKINYYLVVDFDGFTKFIETLGGITVNVERDIYDSRYPGPNYSYETFELKKGVQILDGATALKYVRERHDDPQGDFGRAKRQQQVIQSAKNKVFSLGTILNISTVSGLLSTLEKNVRTDATLSEIESLMFLAKELDTQNISTKVVDAWKTDSLLKVSHVYFGETRAFALVPKVGTYSQIHDLAENIFDLEKIERRKQEFSRENASIKIINESGDSNLTEKIKTSVGDALGIKKYEIQTERSEKTRDESIIADDSMGNKIFTLDELLRIVPAAISVSTDENISTKSDFTLYLGKDLLDIYKYEEVSKEEYDKEQDAPKAQ